MHEVAPAYLHVTLTSKTKNPYNFTSFNCRSNILHSVVFGFIPIFYATTVEDKHSVLVARDFPAVNVVV